MQKLATPHRQICFLEVMVMENSFDLAFHLMAAIQS